MHCFTNTRRDRRLFLQAGAAIAAGSLSVRAPRADEPSPVPPSEKLVIGLMGVNGRGAAIAKGMIASGGAEIAYVCDVDSRAAEKVQTFVGQSQSHLPRSVNDFRRILDDRSVDALICAAPNHWHAPATILACAAGKHVYVEKPCSHTPAEGEWAIEAARKHDCVVQMGTQRRSWSAMIEAIDKLHSGAIGRILYARTWYNNRRGPIGTGKATAVPPWLDWERWQGPATRQAFRDNLVHYNWHWHWHWGNGELGNNGPHGLDLARWGLNVTFPIRVTAGGGKYRHDDDQQTPDTMMVTYDFPEHKTITWEGLSWSPLGPHDSGFGVSFHGTDGSLVIHDAGFTIIDMQGKEVQTSTGSSGDADHFADFLDAIHQSRRPRADIELGHQSTLLCHLGNIAYRCGRVLDTDPTNGQIRNDPEAAAMWTKDYAPGWQPLV
jgi:predicted dehydrogenase